MGWPYVFWLSVIVFVLHFVWEIRQCTVFFVHGFYDETLAGMVRATLGDVVITWMIYGAIALASRDPDWSVRRRTTFRWTMMVTLSLGVAMLIEKRALARGAWSYTDLAPIFPVVEVSGVPVLQFVLLTPLAFALARWATGLARSGQVLP